MKRQSAKRETQRASAARMSVQRVAERDRRIIKKRHLELDPKTGRERR